MIHRITAHVIAAAILASGTTALAQPAHPQSASSQVQASQAPAQPAPVNLNTATKADLEKLPGIGPSMAQRILDYRQKNGSFKKVEELMNIQGIGEKSFLKLKALVTVTPPKTSER
jgi:competence protein ComEA